MHDNRLLHMLHNPMTDLYISTVLRYIGVAMIGVFVPLLMLQWGYSLEAVFFYFLLDYGLHILLITPLTLLGGKIGLKQLILISAFIQIAFYAALQMQTSIITLGLLSGTYKAFFFTGYIIYFGLNRDKAKTSSQIGNVGALVGLANMSGPFLGGLILTKLGFNWLFGAVFVIFMISCIPLFYAKEKPYHIGSLRGVLKKRTLRETLALIGFGWEANAAAFLWPIFIYLAISDNFITIGFLGSLGIILSVVTFMVAGRFTDKHSPKKVHRFGSIGTAIIWGFRSFITTVQGVVLVDIIGNISRSIQQMSFSSMIYERSDRDVINYLVFRELAINLGNMLLFAILVALYDGGQLTGVIGSLLQLIF